MKKYITILLIFLLSVPLVFAEELTDPFEEKQPIVKIVYQGTTPIKNAIDAKSQSPVTILKEETDKVMKEIKYPYYVSSEFKITKYKCDEKMGICGYWVEAKRGGREVYTNSPVWISPPPYEVVVSDVYDERSNTQTITIKEDPKGAVEQVLQRYVDMQPLGKAVSYER